MSPRFLPLVFALAVATLASAGPKHRAVRGPSSGCTFSLSSSLGESVSETGVVNGIVHVTGTPAGCTSWKAFSPVDWITITSDVQNAYVTVAPNPTAEVRSAVITIAGVSLGVTQLGASVISPEPNLLQNAHFDRDLSFWGWQDRFPNGTGAATWSSLDAAGSPASGAMRLTDDTNSGNAYQQSQCVQLTPGLYQYGFNVRASTTTGVQPVIAIVQFATADCSGTYPGYQAKNSFVAQAGVWEKRSFTVAVTDGKQSVLVVVGAWARQPGTQEVWLDDVFLRPGS